MPTIPIILGRELVRELDIAGFRIVRQRGNHVSLQRGKYRTVVPLHDFPLHLARFTPMLTP